MGGQVQRGAQGYITLLAHDSPISPNGILKTDSPWLNHSLLVPAIPLTVIIDSSYVL